jgi:hypothetical protein
VAFRQVISFPLSLPVLTPDGRPAVIESNLDVLSMALIEHKHCPFRGERTKHDDRRCFVFLELEQQPTYDLFVVRYLGR